MSFIPICPQCHSNRLVSKHVGRKVGASVGAAAGFASSLSGAVGGAATGASFAVKHFSNKTPSAPTILSAIIGGLIGGYAIYIGIANLINQRTAIELPLSFMSTPFLIALATVVAGLIVSIIPAFLLRRKNVLRFL